MELVKSQGRKEVTQYIREKERAPSYKVKPSSAGVVDAKDSHLPLSPDEDGSDDSWQYNRDSLMAPPNTGGGVVDAKDSQLPDSSNEDGSEDSPMVAGNAAEEASESHGANDGLVSTDGEDTLQSATSIYSERDTTEIIAVQPRSKEYRPLMARQLTTGQFVQRRDMHGNLLFANDGVAYYKHDGRYKANHMILL